MVRLLAKLPASTAALLLTVLLLGAGRPAASAAINVVAPTDTVAGSFTITQDITFTITTGVGAGNTLLFVLDEWIATDGNGTGANYSPQLSLSLNGAAAATYGAGFFADNLNSSIGNVTPNDGYIGINGGNTLPALSAGNTLTLKAATYTLAPTTNWNPLGTQNFTGNMFFAVNGTQVSNVVAAPEPGSVGLLLGGLALLGARRRRS